MKPTESYSIPKVEGMEQGCALVVVAAQSGNMSYRVIRWMKCKDGLLLEVPGGEQVEIYGNPTVMVHIPGKGKTFELDGTLRDVNPELSKVVLQ